VAAGVAYAACRNAGLPGAANAAAGVGLTAAGAEAAVKVSQSPAGQAAGKAIGSAATAAGQKITAGAGAVKCAAGQACDAAGKAIGSAASAVGQAGSKLLHSVTGGGQRTNDVEMGAAHQARRAQPEFQYRRLAIREPEPEFESLQAREPFPFKFETRDEPTLLYT
jgi:hypothetical protein